MANVEVSLKSLQGTDLSASNLLLFIFLAGNGLSYEVYELVANMDISGVLPLIIDPYRLRKGELDVIVYL